MGSVNDKEMQQRLQAMKEKIAGKKQQDSGYTVNEYGEIVKSANEDGNRQQCQDNTLKDTSNNNSEDDSTEVKTTCSCTAVFFIVCVVLGFLLAGFGGIVVGLIVGYMLWFIFAKIYDKIT